MKSKEAMEIIDIAKTVVKRVPAADVVPVRHGHWKRIDNDAWECTECGILWTFINSGPQENGANYCPNCGAKME